MRKSQRLQKLARKLMTLQPRRQPKTRQRARAAGNSLKLARRFIHLQLKKKTARVTKRTRKQ